MKLKLKSDFLKEEFRFFQVVNTPRNMSVPETAQKFKDLNASVEKMVMHILVSYVTSLEDIANDEGIKLDLDLTYGTVKNINSVIANGFYAWEASSMEEREAISVKSLAAYLMLMCINEHNCGVDILRPALFNPDKIDWSFGWSGCIVRTGTKKKIDLLPIVKKSITFTKDEMTIDDEEIGRAYKEMTGIDLSDYGFCRD